MQVTKCTFHKYGPSGTVQLHDGLCVLPSNIINEKIYIFVWLWLVALSVVTGVFLIYRVAVILAAPIRVALIAVKVFVYNFQVTLQVLLDKTNAA